MATAPQEFEVRKPNGSEGLALVTPTPLVLLQQAMAQGLSIEVLERFQALYERSEAEASRRAYVEAMSRFKDEPLVIRKDKKNTQYGSMYTSLGNLINTVTPYLSKHNLSATWSITQPSQGVITVTCTMRHALGHSESVELTVPPDTSGQKNPIQQIKSAITYAKACTFESACGLASSDANLDDDGRAAGSPAPAVTGLSDERFVHLRDGITNSGDKSELERLYKAACKEASAIGDQEAMRDFNKAKNNRYRELHNAGR